MNAAEEIVKYWYQSQGYFCMESIRLKQNREIDLLAIKLSDDKKTIVEKLHIEIQVSSNSINNKTAKELADLYHEKKFLKVREYVTEYLGKDYKMIEVRGKIFKGSKSIRDEYIKIRTEQGVTVIPFETILEDIKNVMGTGIQLNPIINAVGLTKFHSLK